MTLTQKRQRALFRALARAALEIEGRLDDDLDLMLGDGKHWERLDSALRDIARTTFAKRLPALRRD